MARACGRTRFQAPVRKRGASRCRGSGHWRLRGRAPRRHLAAGWSRRGFRPCPARHTRAPAPVLNRRPPVSPDWTSKLRPLYPLRSGKAPQTAMTESTLPDYAVPAQAAPLTRRRAFFTVIVLASMIGLIWLLSYALTAGGFTALDFVLVVLFAITLPWSVIGFWNATIGLFIMRSADPVAAVTPVRARGGGGGGSRSRPKPRSSGACATRAPSASSATSSR